MDGPALPTKFSANGFPLLSVGQTMDLLARAPSLWVHVKVYAEGGENGLHAHPSEDHVFVVLDGEATFTDATGARTVVSRNDGMLIPRNTLYSFLSSGDRNLVMLRIGAPAATGAGDPDAAVNHRVDRDGDPAPGDAPSNGAGAIPGVPIPGAFVAPELSERENDCFDRRKSISYHE